MLHDRSLQAEWTPDLRYLAASMVPKFAVTAEKSLSISNNQLFSRSVPFALLQELPKHRLSWQLAHHSDDTIAILMDNQVVIARQPTTGQHKHALNIVSSFAVDEDPHPHWRTLTWSPDGRFLVVSHSSGTVDIFHRASGVLVYRIVSSSLKRSHDSASQCDLRGSTARSLPVLAALKRTDSNPNFNLSQFFVDPMAVIFFTDPDELGRTVFDGERFDYELICVSFDGTLRSYLMRSDLPERDYHNNDVHETAAMNSIAYPPLLVIEREERDACNAITFHHKFRSRSIHEAVICAQYSRKNRILCLAGKSRDVGSAVSFWRLTPNPPYYTPVLTRPSAAGQSAQHPTTYLQRFMGWLSGAGSGEQPLGSEDQTQAPGFFDSTFGIFVNWRKRNRAFLDAAVHNIALSPDESQLISLSFSGEAKLWSVMPRGTERDGHLISTFSNSQLVAICSPTDKEKTVDSETETKVEELSWWSRAHLGVILTDGSYTVCRVEDGVSLKRAFDAVEQFGPTTKLVYPGKENCAAVFECSLQTVRGRVKPDGSLLGWRLAEAEEPEELSDESESQSRRLAAYISQGVGYLMKPVRYFTDTFLWNFDSETLKIKEIRLRVRTFRIFRLAEVSAQTLLLHQIADGKFEEALQLASAYKLNTDLIYKEQWLITPVSSDSIEAFLEKISDIDWRLDQCLNRICDSGEAQELLYSYGLRLTVGVESVIRESSRSTATHLPPELEKTCLVRLQLLEYLDRLCSCREIIEISKEQFEDEFKETSERCSFFVEAFARFRDVNLVAQAIYYAGLGAVSALAILFTRHGKEVLPYRFQILNSIPETFPPSEYAVLLPRIQTVIAARNELTWIQHPWREELDWVEYESVVKLISREETAPMKTDAVYQSPYPASVDIIKDWYVSRIKAIDTLSGQMSLALDLARIGIENGVPGLEYWLELCYTLSNFLYDPIAEDAYPSSNAIDLVSFDQVNDQGKLGLLTARGIADWSHSRTGDLFLHDLHRHIFPFFERRAKINSSGETSIDIIMRPIADHIFELTKVDMAYCLLIAQDPESLFDNRHLADLIVRCCINSAKEDHWDVIEQLIQLPLFSQISTYQAEVKLVRKFVSAAKLMAKFGYPTTVGRLTALSGDENGQKQLLFRLIRSSLNGRSDKASPPVEVILENIMELRRLVCPRVDKKDIFESFIAQLLASGEQQLHQYAQLLLFPIKEADGLPVSAVDRIIFGSYQDFFDNAASGDMYNGLLKSAVSCLRLIVKQTALPERFSELQRRAQSELEFVEAIHAVCTEFDREKDILPIQIRLEKDKIKFIRQMLQFDPKFYRKKSNLLEILRKLLQINPEVFSGRTKEILVLKCRLLFYLCDAAKNSGDASAALENCNEIISIYSSTLALVSGKKFIATAASGLDSQIADLTSVCCYELASYPDLLGIIERKRLNSIAITVHSEYRPGLGFDDRRISVSMLTLLEQSRQLDKEACINEATEMLLQHLPTHFNGSLDDFITQPTAIKALCTRIPDTTEQIARPRFYQGLSSMAKLDSRKFGPDLSLIDAAADLLLLMRDDALLALLSVKAHLQQDIVEAIADLLCLRKETIESVVVRLADCPENIPPIKAYLGLFCCSWKIAEEARMAKTELVKQSPTSLFEYALQVSKGMPDSIWTRNLRVFEECFKKYEQTELLQEICKDKTVDATKFESSYDYRQSILTKLSCSPDWTDVERSVSLALKYEMDPSGLAIENWTKTFILGGETDLVSVYEKLSQLLGKQAYRENLLKRALDFLHLQERTINNFNRLSRIYQCLLGQKSAKVSEATVKQIELRQRISNILAESNNLHISMSDLIFAKYGCLRVGEEFNVVELASKERILFELGANIDYETAELFTEIVNEINQLRFVNDSESGESLKQLVVETVGDRYLDFESSFIWRSALSRLVNELFSDTPLPVIDEPTKWKSVINQLSMEDYQYVFNQYQKHFVNCGKKHLNGAFHLAKILHNADIEINEEIDTFLQSVECLASMPQKDCNLWLKGVQSFWLASTEKNSILTRLIIAGVPLQLTKILVPMAGDTKCSTVYKEAIINLQFNDPSNQQNLFRLLKNLKQQRNEQSFEEIWQAAEEAVRQLIKHQQSKNRNDRMILVFAGMLREADEGLEKETNLRLVVQNCWPNVSIPGDLSGWHNHNQLFQSLLESPDNDAERLLRLAYLISEWKMAGNTQQLQVGLLKKCADLATKNNIHDATLIAAWILLDCSEEDEKQFSDISATGTEFYLLLMLSNRQSNHDSAREKLLGIFSHPSFNQFVDRPVFSCLFVLSMGDSLRDFPWHQRPESLNKMAQSLLNAAAKFPNDSPRISCSLPCCFDTAYLRLLLFVQQQILGDEANGREFYEPIATRLAQRYLGVPDMFMHFGVGELLVKRVLSRQPIAQIRPAAPVDAAVLSLFSNQDPSDAPWPPEEWQSRISVLLHSYIAGRY